MPPFSNKKKSKSNSYRSDWAPIGQESFGNRQCFIKMSEEGQRKKRKAQRKKTERRKREGIKKWVRKDNKKGEKQREGKQKQEREKRDKKNEWGRTEKKEKSIEKKNRKKEERRDKDLNPWRFFKNSKSSEFLLTLALKCRKNGKNRTKNKKTTPKMPFWKFLMAKTGGRKIFFLKKSLGASK